MIILHKKNMYLLPYNTKSLFSIQNTPFYSPSGLDYPQGLEVNRDFIVTRFSLIRISLNKKIFIYLLYLKRNKKNNEILYSWHNYYPKFINNSSSLSLFFNSNFETISIFFPQAWRQYTNNSNKNRKNNSKKIYPRWGSLPPKN